MPNPKQVLTDLASDLGKVATHAAETTKQVYQAGKQNYQKLKVKLDPNSSEANKKAFERYAQGMRRNK